MNQHCWCGNTDLKEFSPEYWRCDVCSTLMSKSFPVVDITAIANEDGDFYGKKYWLEHQVEELGLASIEQRSRSDLLDRCGRWLAQLLEFSLPPSRLLEIGCSHGGFLGLAELAGFRVTGIELSPWVVEFARKSFGVDVRTGPIERQSFPGGSFDVICMFDVLEHLQDPVRTLEYCAQALTPNGMLLIQTPQYPVRTDFAALQERQHPFLKMMLPHEHLFLFSNESVKRLLTEVGFSSCEFVQAPFAHYDMMFAAGKGLLSKKSVRAKQAALEASGGGRMVEAFLSSLQESFDNEAQRQELHAHFVQASRDIETLQVDAKRLSEEKDHLSEEKDHLSEERDHLSEERGYLNQWLRQTYEERNALRKRVGFGAAIRKLSNSLFAKLGERFPARVARRRRESTRVCIDVADWLGRGNDGGLTAPVMDFLTYLCRDERFNFIYVAGEQSLDGIRSLLRPNDSLILISPNAGRTPHGRSKIEVTQRLTPANLRRHHPDIFYAPFGEISPAARDCKSVCLIPDLPHRDFAGLVPPDQLGSRESNISNSLSSAAKVQVSSEYTRQRLIAAYPISPADTIVTYLRRADNPAGPSKRQRAQPFFFCPEGYYSRKSVEILMSAYKEYLGSPGTSNWDLVFAGHRDDVCYQLLDLVRSFGLDAKVEFVAKQPAETFSSLFQEAGALLYPTLHDGAGIPIFDAFRFDVPIICSSFCSLPEVAGAAALYVDPHAANQITYAMREVSSSVDIRSRLVELGKQRLKDFNIEQQVDKVAAAFLELTERRYDQYG
jgi:2-polyprenyl-3-methyl-5-hydroxy-6-metoxy-1,4-benzoquinol methylase/glycosyltransferase involved in cell wall biosynthesis